MLASAETDLSSEIQQFGISNRSQVTNDPRRPRQPGEIAQILEEQLMMLKDRCDAYYAGKSHEAKAASGHLYVLLHDHGKSAQSVLTQVGQKQSTRYLDSRMRGTLTLNSAKGAWPWTVIPMRHHKNSDFFDFDEWWTDQPFHILRKDVVFTRKELIETIRHREGGGHVDPMTEKRIAALKQTRSPWRRSIRENEDGSAELYVGIDLKNEPADEDSDMEEINDYELASVIAIAEEVLFSLTPEPDNRLRMHHPDMQKSYYLDAEECEITKSQIQSDVNRLKSIDVLAPGQDITIGNAVKALEAVLAKSEITRDDANVRFGVAQIMKLSKIDWPEIDK